MNEFIKEPSKHSHISDPHRCHIIKIRSASSDEKASTILYDVLRATPLAVTAALPSAEVLLQTSRRERKPIQLGHNGLSTLMLRETDRGENFVHYEDDSMIIFTCENNRPVLQDCRRTERSTYFSTFYGSNFNV